MLEAEWTTGSHGSVNAILPLLEYLEAAGFDWKRLLADAGIADAVIADSKTRLPKKKFQALWQAASEVTRDPAIALRVATLARPNALGIIGYLAAASDSRRSAFELIKGLTPLLWENFDCALSSEGEVAFLRCGSDAGRPQSRVTTDYAVGLAVAMSRVFAATRSDPLEARFTYPAPPHAAEYERILRLPVRFDAEESGVLFPISMLHSLNPAADAALRQLLERHAADQLARIPSGAGLQARVRACILSMLPLGTLTAATVAERFALSDRTLRRRLELEATSYQQILDEVRAELAEHYLTREKQGIDEVAFRLGFSDRSAFTKAFRRWGGRTPASVVGTKRSPVRKASARE